MMPLLRNAGQFLVIAALFAGVAALSDWPRYSSIPADSGVVMVTFIHGADRKASCRKLTPAEIAKLPPNMRRTQECPRGRPPIYLELEIDNRTVYAETLHPTGIAGDAPSRVYERFVLPAKDYDLKVRMRDVPGTPGFNYAREERIALAPGQLFVIDFDPAGHKFIFR